MDNIIELIKNKFCFNCKIDEEIVHNLNTLNVNEDDINNETYSALELALNIAKNLNYKKNLKISYENRYKLFKNKVELDFGTAYNIFNEKLIWYYISKFKINNKLAEDLSSKCLIQSLEKIELFDSNLGAYYTWLLKMAENIFNGEIKKIKKFEPIDDIKEECEEYNISKDLLIYDKVKLLKKEINELPIKYKNILILREIKNYKYIEIQDAFSDISFEIINESVELLLKGVIDYDIIKFINNKFINNVEIEDYHIKKKFDNDVLNDIKEKYNKHKCVLMSILENILLNGENYTYKRKTLDLNPFVLNYWMNKNEEVLNINGIYSNLNEVEKKYIFDEYINNNIETINFIIVGLIYDSLAFNLSTIKSQIKSGRDKLRNRLKDKINKLENEDIYYNDK